MVSPLSPEIKVDPQVHAQSEHTRRTKVISVSIALVLIIAILSFFGNCAVKQVYPDPPQPVVAPPTAKVKITCLVQDENAKPLASTAVSAEVPPSE